jgi:hypothetical protein
VTRTVLAALALVGLVGLVGAGCSDSPTCDDVDSLTEQLDSTDPDDQEFNDLVSELKQAQADCNAG